MPARLRRVMQAGAIVVLAGLIGLFALSLRSTQTTVVAQLNDGGTPAAPDETLHRLDGGTTSLAAYRGKIVVVNFWASWCDPCRAEAPLLNQVASDYRNRGVVVLGIDSQDFTSAAKAFARRERLTYPLVRDANGDVSGRWGVTNGFPVTFVVDRHGDVRRYFPQEVTGADLTGALDPLLHEEPA